jgi:phage repressor protein C with HTH and peptisase S24 domain
MDLENNPLYPAIRRVKLKAQAGASGISVDYGHEDDGQPVVFRADWYKMKGYKPEKMLALRVKGESMVPALYEDDLIIINTMSTTPKDGTAFLVNYEGEIVIKRLIRDDGMWWLTSDNPDQRRYSRKICNAATEIIGEAVYRQTERI